MEKICGLSPQPIIFYEFKNYLLIKWDVSKMMSANVGWVQYQLVLNHFMTSSNIELDPTSPEPKTN
jgi:hypothetical protein